MQIWVDADACPKVIKEILYRAAKRVQINLILVANLPLKVPASSFIKTIQVPGGFDVADEKIIEQVQSGDLVITADIPLAALVIDKDALVLTPRGKFHTRDTIQESLTMRNLKDELRSSGVDTGGPPPFNNTDREVFANQLDRFLTKR